MKIRCWGARGSIPVSGPEYLKYGGDTTCLEIRTSEDEVIILDAGTGIRKLGNRLLEERRYRYNMILTHTHWDHILGFPFFKPIYLSQTAIRLFGCPFTQDSVKKMISQVMTVPNFPVDFEKVQAEISYHQACETSFAIQSMEVTPIALSHPNPGNGYKFSQDGRVFVFLTDNELTFQHPGGLEYADYVHFSSGADLLIHDSEYTREEYPARKTWGHSVYDDALKLALDAKVKKFGLFHHNQERTDAAVDKMVRECRRAVEVQKAHLECFGVYQGMEIQL